ncbi:MAG TPA: hypothetical protein VGV34_02185, partial [Solirubrobacterales bacterium]|nr:hypothetical protein [Solirubrobacterales bacterium]
MRRAPFVFLFLVLLAPAPAAAQERPKLAATLAACETGPDPEQRFAVFTGSMPAMKGTHHMSMRFDLEEIDPPPPTGDGQTAAAAMPERVAA